MPDGSCLESNLLSEVGGGALTFGLTSDDGETVLERSDAISGCRNPGNTMRPSCQRSRPNDRTVLNSFSSEWSSIGDKAERFRASQSISILNSTIGAETAKP
jgi:hypothetical protein